MDADRSVSSPALHRSMTDQPRRVLYAPHSPLYFPSSPSVAEHEPPPAEGMPVIFARG